MLEDVQEVAQRRVALALLGLHQARVVQGKDAGVAHQPQEVDLHAGGGVRLLGGLLDFPGREGQAGVAGEAGHFPGGQGEASHPLPLGMEHAQNPDRLAEVEGVGLSLQGFFQGPGIYRSGFCPALGCHSLSVLVLPLERTRATSWEKLFTLE